MIDLPGIEAYRKFSLEVMEDRCKFGVVKIRAAAGEAKALRSYAPSAEKCSKFVDPLEGEVDLMTFWRELVNSDCQNNASPSSCRASFFSHEGDADSIDRVRWEVLQYGWTKCSTAYLKSYVDRKRSEEMLTALEREFGRRFKIKNPPCSSD